MPPPNPRSSVHQLAEGDSNIILDNEHTFDSLETPTLFIDPMHFNGPGEERFSAMLGRRVREILGTPR